MATLSKSDFQLARTCVTKLYYKENGYPRNDDENAYLEMLIEGGYMVEQLARLMYPEGEELEYGRDPLLDWEKTRERLREENVTLFEATFLSGCKLARVDILEKRGNNFDLIEVKSKSFDGSEERSAGPFRGKRRTRGEYAILTAWKPYIEDVAFQIHILRELFPEATVTPYLLLVDKSKTTSSEGLPGLFSIKRNVDVNNQVKDLEVRFTGDPKAIVPGEFLSVLNVSEEVEDLLPEVVEEAERLSALYRTTESEEKTLEVEESPNEVDLALTSVIRKQRPIDWSCRDCEFRVKPNVEPSGLKECWGDLAEKEHHIFDLYQLGSIKPGGVRLGDEMIREGRTSLFDVDPERLVKTDGTPSSYADRQKIQIEHTRDGTVWFGEDFREIGGLNWPLHFIDFETSQLAVPYHEGMHPYEKVAFQWSCHTLTEPNATPNHSEWLNVEESWPNALFIEALREAVGDEGTLLMWSPYERTVLRDIRDQLARYEADKGYLVDWFSSVLGDDERETRLYDLNDLCLRAFFHPGMRGRTSIKVVLDALWKAEPVMRQRYAEWANEPVAIPDGAGPYEGLPPIEVAGITLNVADGTDAMKAYQEMLYGASRDEPAVVGAYADLLRRYCELDTLAMVLIWDSWQRALSIY